MNKNKKDKVVEKVCLICDSVIDTKKEFCEFKHYRQECRIRSRSYYHVNCFRRRLNGSSDQELLFSKARELLNKVEARIN